MDDDAKAEAYADKFTRILFDSVVIPYMRRVYGDRLADRED